MAEPLDRECAAFCRYLIGREPTERVRARYREAHALGVVEAPGTATAFDRLLVSIARAGALPARLADAHARVFRKAGLLRRKLVLLLALLESHADTAGDVDAPTPGGPNGFVVGAAARVALFALLLCAGALVLLPARAACALAGGRS